MLKKMTIWIDTDRAMGFDDIRNNSKEYTPIRNIRKVECYTLAGKYLRTYNSAEEAALDMKISINYVYLVCSGRVLYSTKGSRILLYAGSSIRERLRLIKGKVDHRRKKKL
jgi:hypothetical protein